MPREFIIRTIILSAFGISYFIFTLSYFRHLQKNILFTKNLRLFHSVMIWLVPFVWIFLLKGLTGSAAGSHEIENKNDPEPFSNDGGAYISGDQ
jgi:hypothetical protein